MNGPRRLLAIVGLMGLLWGCDAVEGGGEPLPSLDGPVEVATTSRGLGNAYEQAVYECLTSRGHNDWASPLGRCIYANHDTCTAYAWRGPYSGIAITFVCKEVSGP